MAISVTQPIGRAIDRAKLITFQPFDLGKWFAIGFLAFLADLAEGGASSFNGGGGGSGGGGTGSGGPQPDDVLDPIMQWITSHVAIVVVIAMVILLLMIAFYILIIWLSSRGTFMFTHAIARNSSEVKVPWRRFRQLGNSLCKFRIMLGVIGLAAMLVIGGICLAVAWADIQSKQFGGGSIAAIIIGGLLFLLIAFAIALIDWCTTAFVTVIMYARDMTVGPAWREFRANMLSTSLGSIILFGLMSILLAIPVAICQVILGCCTLCIGFLPYLSSVVALPLLIFMRAYQIYYVQQFAPEYQIIEEPPQYGFQVLPVIPLEPPPFPPSVG